MKCFGTIKGVITEDNIISLTFDDGPDEVYTKNIVNLLNDYNAKATFFVVGENAVKYPEIIKYIYDNGHEIGNHTWNHKSLPTLSKNEKIEQIIKAKRQLEKYESPYFRPPFGHYDLSSHYLVSKLGYTTITWSFNINDWEDKDENFFSSKLIKYMKRGKIVLLHDSLYDIHDNSLKDRTPLISALKNILENKSSEYKFVTISHLLKNNKITRESYRKPKNQQI